MSGMFELLPEKSCNFPTRGRDLDAQAFHQTRDRVSHFYIPEF
jgi:hypothetical protein